MSTWTTHATVTGLPDEVLDLLTEPEAIRSWAPIPFDLRDLDGDRLETGSRARVCGSIAGRSVEFDVEVLEADDGRLALLADGPISLDVEYIVRPADTGSEVLASVSVRRGSGLVGRVLEHATNGLLAAGALNTAVSRIGQQLEPALAA